MKFGRFFTKAFLFYNKKHENMKTKTVTMIDVSEFNGLVIDTYGKPYDFQQQDGCKGRGIEWITVPCEDEDFENETIEEIINGEEMGVNFKAWLNRDIHTPVGERIDEFGIALFWERNFYPHVSMIINDLHKKGLLQSGKYAINIDW